MPLDRGILETIYASLAPGTTEAQVTEALERAYADAPFVRLTGEALPEIEHVAHTNFCDIGWIADLVRRARRSGVNLYAMQFIADRRVQEEGDRVRPSTICLNRSASCATHR